jgi:hypothetical protein
MVVGAYGEARERGHGTVGRKAADATEVAATAAEHLHARIVGALAIRAYPMLGGGSREAEPSGRGLGIAAACGDRVRDRIREPTAIHRKER